MDEDETPHDVETIQHYVDVVLIGELVAPRLQQAGLHPYGPLKDRERPGTILDEALSQYVGGNDNPVPGHNWVKEVLEHLQAEASL